MSKFTLLCRISILFIVWSCPILRTVKAIRYFKCTKDVQLFHKAECAQDCVPTEIQLESTETINEGTSKAITTNTFNDMGSSMKTSTRAVNDDTTLFEISGDSLDLDVLKFSTSSERLGTSVKRHTFETTQPGKVTLLGSTEGEFNDQKTTLTKTRRNKASGQLTLSTSTNDPKTSTKETFTSQSHHTTERNRLTTHELTSKTVLMTGNKVHSEQTSTSGKFQNNKITTEKEPTATTTRTIQHTINHLSTTKDHPITEEENSTSKTMSSERNVTTKTAHTSKLNPFTTETRSVRQNSTSKSTHSMKQETSASEARTTEMSSTTNQEINTTKLTFSTMTTSSRHTHLTTGRPTTPPSCPTNMVYMNCSCQSTCENPNNCYNNCAEAETCICPDGFYLMGVNCVPPEECNCYDTNEGVIIQEDDTQLVLNCTQQCSCLNGVLSCNNYQCDTNALCDNGHGNFECHCKDGYHGDGVSCTRLSDCTDVYDVGLVEDGVYTILPTGWTEEAFEVYCKDGWNVFQRRIDGSVDFFLYWADYKEGFGDPKHEMWLGLERLFYLTNQGFYALKISLIRDFIPYEINHNFFRISNEADNYRLTELGAYIGDIGTNTMDYHHGFQFSTRDRDNDNHPTVDCAGNSKGAWWHKQCWKITLNGPYGSPDLPGVCYVDSGENYCNVAFTEMMVKRL